MQYTEMMTMGNINYFCDRMVWYCEECNLGYGQDTRWNVYDGGEADCSSLIITALRDAGFDTGDATYTGDILPALAVRGWTLAHAPLQRGDILLAPGAHVAAYIGDGLIAEAAINENGDIINGIPGDQTGRETRVTEYYDYPWDYILRYAGDDNTDITEIISRKDPEMLILTDENEIGYLLVSASCKPITYEQAVALAEIGVENRRVSNTTLYRIREAIHEAAYDIDVTAGAYKAAAQRLAASG